MLIEYFVIELKLCMIILIIIKTKNKNDLIEIKCKITHNTNIIRCKCIVFKLLI